MVIEISVAVIAVAFVLLVIYLIVMTKALRVTFHQINHTLIDVRKQLDEVGGQAKKVIEHTNQVSFDVKRKMESLDSVFNALSNVGEILEHKTSALKKDIFVSLDKENRHSTFDFSRDRELHPRERDSREHELHTYELNKVSDILELAVIGFRLWQKMKKRR